MRSADTRRSRRAGRGPVSRLNPLAAISILLGVVGAIWIFRADAGGVLVVGTAALAGACFLAFFLVGCLLAALADLRERLARVERRLEPSSSEEDASSPEDAAGE